MTYAWLLEKLNVIVIFFATSDIFICFVFKETDQNKTKEFHQR